MCENDVYYKLYKSHRNGLITIVCMQWFDEWDYHEDRFVRNTEGVIHKFSTEDEAKQKLNEWYKPHEIDPEYRDTDTSLIRD
jgi:hypothetical protein